MRPALFDDEALRTRLRAETAVAAMRQALLHAEDGALAAPPRVSADLGPGRMVFTVGALAGRWFGYRSYDTFPASPGAQVVVLHDWDDGQVKAIAAGNELGPRRTGAIGAVAVDVLAQPGASRLAVIGTGAQAWTQVWAVRAVRDLDQVLVYSRDPANRVAFAARARDQLGVAATEAPSARDAVSPRLRATGSPARCARWWTPRLQHCPTRTARSFARGLQGLDRGRTERPEDDRVEPCCVAVTLVPKMRVAAQSSSPPWRRHACR